MTTDYDINVKREGRWWMIYVPAIDGITQARRLSEVDEMARSLISISTDTPLTDFHIQIKSIELDSPHIRELTKLLDAIKTKRQQIKALTTEVHRDSRAFAHVLYGENIPIRDTAWLFGVSPQRVSQLLNEQGDSPAGAIEDEAYDLADRSSFDRPRPRT